MIYKEPDVLIVLYFLLNSRFGVIDCASSRASLGAIF